MSSFLHNLARRGAGMAVDSVRAPAPLPVRVESRPLRPAAPEAAAAAPDEASSEGGPIEERAREALAGGEVGQLPACGDPPRPSATLKLGPSAASERLAPADTSPLTPPPVPAALQRPAAVVRALPSANPAAAKSPRGRRAGEGVAASRAGKRREAPTIVRSAPAAAAAGGVAAEVSVESSAAASETASAEPPAAVPAGRAPSPTVRPAPDVAPPLRLPKPGAATSPPPPTPAPIHVRIGRVEVRDTSPPPPPFAASASPPIGFAAYSRIRRYRSPSV
jgi:hypothetical protein